MFQQGLSGLNAASKSLSVIGNNIANASTVGFKRSEAQFADLYVKAKTKQVSAILQKLAKVSDRSQASGGRRQAPPDDGA